jgi:hypothetical protein
MLQVQTVGADVRSRCLGSGVVQESAEMADRVASVVRPTSFTWLCRREFLGVPALFESVGDGSQVDPLRNFLLVVEES